MDVSGLLIEAAVLMFTGMVVVFVFLTILIFTIKGMSRALANFDTPKVKPNPVKLSGNQVPTSHVAAIAAAVKQYREKQ
ncbi:OadG family protein [Pseudoalteromonas sp.]|uniref:OadG family protein n=1 Tax=Pseudoalteromonas sp. TaxID=53249 RepID=UPI00356A4D29